MDEAPVVGFAGHIDLARVGPIAQTRAALEAVFGRIARVAPRARLITGVAEGADRLAIAAWHAAVGPSVDALLPAAAAVPGHASLTVEAGHGGVAEAIAMRCRLLVAVWDGGPGRGTGGTQDVVERVRGRRRPCIVIGRSGLADTPDWASLIDLAAHSDPI